MHDMPHAHGRPPCCMPAGHSEQFRLCACCPALVRTTQFEEALSATCASTGSDTPASSVVATVSTSPAGGTQGVYRSLLNASKNLPPRPRWGLALTSGEAPPLAPSFLSARGWASSHTCPHRLVGQTPPRSGLRCSMRYSHRRQRTCLRHRIVKVLAG